MDFKLQNLKNAMLDIVNDVAAPYIKQEDKCTKTQAVVTASVCAVAGFAIGFGTKCLLDKMVENKAKKMQEDVEKYFMQSDMDFPEDTEMYFDPEACENFTGEDADLMEQQCDCETDE